VCNMHSCAGQRVPMRLERIIRIEYAAVTETAKPPQLCIWCCSMRRSRERPASLHVNMSHSVGEPADQHHIFEDTQRSPQRKRTRRFVAYATSVLTEKNIGERRKAIASDQMLKPE
jgi:hypothetical protein